MKYIMFDLNERGERVCKRHFWKDGWICEKCGLRRYDYEYRFANYKEIEEYEKEYEHDYE